MPDRELYQRIAGGVAPWTVGEIKVESAAQQLEVQVESSHELAHRCPHCDCMLLVCDHGKEQTWRQPDDGPWQILLKGRLPLVECPNHGKVGVSPPWADWYVRGLDKSLLGPWSLQQLKLLLDAGRISPNTLLKRGCSNRWVITGTVSALFVKQEATVEPALSLDELAAVDWAIANGPADSIPDESPTLDCLATVSDTFLDEAAQRPDDDQLGDVKDEPCGDRQTSQPMPDQDAKPQPVAINPLLAMLDDVDSDAMRDPQPNVGSSPLLAPVAPEKLPRTRAEPRPSELALALEQTATVQGTNEVVRKTSAVDAASQPAKATREPEKLTRTRGKPWPSELTLALEQTAKVERPVKVVRMAPVGDDATEPVKATTREPEKPPAKSAEDWLAKLTLAPEQPATVEPAAKVVRKTPVDDAATERAKAMARKPEKIPAARDEPSPSEWCISLNGAAKMEATAKVIRKKPVDAAPAKADKASTRRQALVRKEGFQQGYEYLTIAYLINSCLVGCLVPLICMNFFGRLLVLSASVFIPFGATIALKEEQLVACGLAALSMLVMVGFPLWHLISNGGILWQYVPSALVGMAVGFGIPPDYLDEACAALQWSEIGLGFATVGLTLYTLFSVPAKSRMSLPIFAAVLLTGLSAIALCTVRPGSMLTVDAGGVPPQIRGALPDAALFVIGLYGTLAFIPGAILFELYRHTDGASREFIVRSGVIGGAYLLAGLATVGSFVHGSGMGFFDLPLALLPLGCINALAASIPSVMALVNPQLSVQD